MLWLLIFIYPLLPIISLLTVENSQIRAAIYKFVPNVTAPDSVYMPNLVNILCQVVYQATMKIIVTIETIGTQPLFAKVAWDSFMR